MKLLVQQEFKDLVTHSSSPCVSIYLPIHRGLDNQQDPIRLKNLSSRARDYLIAQGMRGAEAREFLEPVTGLADDTVICRATPGGLAIFRSPELFSYYQTPMEVVDTVVVSHRFHLKPLLPMMAKGHSYYVLALNLKGVRLFHGAEKSISEVPLECPTSLDELLNVFEISDSLNHHAGASRGGGVVTTAHAQGTSTDETWRKKQIVQFFKGIDNAIIAMLHNTRTPLILAGVKYLCALYREAGTYRGLVEEEVSGSPPVLDERELHRQAWAAMEPSRDKGRSLAMGQYKELAGTSMASSDIRVIIRAAYSGAIQTLLLPNATQKWGNFDPGTGVVTVVERQAQGDEDLCDVATTYTLMHGGDVFVIPGTDQANPAPLAAVFRRNYTGVATKGYSNV